jgi:large subunit ribosomal protein L9
MAKKGIKVLLRKDIAKFGKAGEIKEVSPGYARNFLLQKGVAILATEGIIAAEKKREEHELKANADSIAAASVLAKTLEAKLITLRVKAGQKGKLFGSVTKKEIARAIHDQLSATVTEAMIELPQPIKTLGKHKVALTLVPKVSASLTLQIVSEKS